MNPEENIQQQEPITATEPITETKKSPAMSIPAAILTGAVIIGLAIVFAFGPKKSATSPTAVVNNQEPTTESPTSVSPAIVTVRPVDYVYGDKNAQVIIFEYSDSDCPFCQQFHKTMKDTLAKYSGKVAWVYRFFPLNIHPNSYNEAVALSCVGELGGQKAFWAFLDSVMDMTLTPGDASTKALTSTAMRSGVDGNLFTACIKNADTAQIDTDITTAKKIGAKGTPFSIAVNTKTGAQQIIPGAVPAEFLEQIIESLLK